MRRRITYANVAATMALVFSMTGGALAAKHYLINSTSQISPKVLKKLKGKTGATGAIGATGAAGAAGAAGATGKEGKTGPPGPTTLSKLEFVEGPEAETEFFFLFDVAASEAICPAGSTAISGGGNLEESKKAFFWANHAIIEGGKMIGWSAVALYPELVGGVQAFAYCAKEGNAVQAARPRSAAQNRARREALIKDAIAHVQH
jgi:hypothetical protein